MTDFNLESFADLNNYAAEIARQNALYERDSHLYNSVSAVNAQNRTAAKQRELVSTLGELSELLPYREFGLEHDAAITELDGLESQLTNRGCEIAGRRCGAIALAGHLSGECYIHLSETISVNLDERLTQIDDIYAQDDLEDRVLQLRSRVEQLDAANEIVGRAWPVPTAHLIEVEPTVLPRSPVRPSPEFSLPAEPENGNGITRPEAGGLSGRTWEVLGKVQREATNLVIDYMSLYPGKTITAEELAEHLYKDCLDEADLSVGRRRVVSIMWQDKKFGRITEGLEAAGKQMEIGKANYILVDDNSQPVEKIGVRKIWRAVEAGSQNNSDGFTDTIYIDALGRIVNPASIAQT